MEVILSFLRTHWFVVATIAGGFVLNFTYSYSIEKRYEEKYSLISEQVHKSSDNYDRSRKVDTSLRNNVSIERTYVLDNQDKKLLLKNLTLMIEGREQRLNEISKNYNMIVNRIANTEDSARRTEMEKLLHEVEQVRTDEYMSLDYINQLEDALQLYIDNSPSKASSQESK